MRNESPANWLLLARWVYCVLRKRTGQLFLCLNKYHTMKAYGGAEV